MIEIMKKILLFFIFAFSFNAIASVYLEGDLLHPILKTTNRTNESSIDLRLGHETDQWDFSVRYYQVKGISYSGGYSGAGSISISDAEDTYFSLRAGYKIGAFTVGAGIGTYNRDFETSLDTNDTKNYGKNVLGLEVFISHKWLIDSFFIKPEVNYTTANVPTSASRSSGGNSYDVDFIEPSLNLLVLIGFQF
jgi:hypothetical protein